MQNKCKMLGVRPYPLSCENFSSYLLRLCYLNGIERISELLIAAGVNKPKTTGFSDWNEKHYSDAIDVLTVLLNRDKNKIGEKHDIISGLLVTNSSESTTDEDARLFSPLRQIQRLNTPFLRICPTCVDETNIINSQWQCLTVARCPKHNVRLIDCCPVCDKSLEWHSDIFEHCTNCGFKWSEYEDKQYCEHEFSDLEYALLPNEDGSILNEDTLVKSLCTVIVAVARPFDVFIDSFERLPKINYYSDLLLRALDCYANSDAYKKWIVIRQERLSPLAINSDFVLDLPTRSNNKATCLYQFNLPVNEINVEYVEFVKQKRRKLILEGNLDRLRHHIKPAQLSVCLGLTTINFHYLINVIKPINGSPVLRERLFDITQVDSFMQSLNCTANYEDKVSITDSSKILRVFMVDYGAVLSALLAGEISGEVANKVSFSKVFVEYSSLILFLKKELKASLNSPVSIAKAGFCLCCAQKKILSLVEEGKLQYAPWQRVNKISGESLSVYWKIRYNASLLREMIDL